jgi:hypothetical protein
MANNVNTNLDPAITIKKPDVIDPSTIAKSTIVNINIDPQLNSAKKHSVIVQPTAINRNTIVNTGFPVTPPTNNITLNETVIAIVQNYLDTYHGIVGSSSHANIADFANAVTYSSILGRPTFSTVAFTGDYNSLNNIPGVTNYATFSYVDSAVSNLVNSAPAALNTLNELANAIANDSSFSSTISSALGNRLRVDIGTQNLNTSQKANAITNLGLATVANTGSYSDLTNKPTIVSAFTNDAGYMTALQVQAYVATQLAGVTMNGDVDGGTSSTINNTIIDGGAA